MSGMKLNDAINQACEDLAWVVAAVAEVRGSITLSRESYTFFEMSETLAIQLEHARGLLAVRDVALRAARAYPGHASSINPEKFVYNGVEVTFKQGRFLVLQSYVAITWTMYDALAKVAGVLCCVDERSKNATKPVKLPEDLLRGQRFVGARVHDHLKGAYGRPIGISYAVRNWLVHDGHSQNGIELFKFYSPTPAPFEMSDTAWSKIEDKCLNEYKADPSHTRLRSFPDVRGDLLEGMVCCHQEADEAIGFVLAWSSGAARLQAAILLPRDGTSASIPGPSVLA